MTHEEQPVEGAFIFRGLGNHAGMEPMSRKGREPQAVIFGRCILLEIWIETYVGFGAETRSQSGGHGQPDARRYPLHVAARNLKGAVNLGVINSAQMTGWNLLSR